MFRRFSSALVALMIAAPVFAAPRAIALKSRFPAKSSTTQTTPAPQSAPVPQTAPAPTPAPAPAPVVPTFGTFSLSATQNGLPATAQFQLLNADSSVAFSGATGLDHTVPTGSFTLKAVSNGAVFTTPVVINAEQRTESCASFSTGRLSVSISSSNGSTAGIAKIYAAGVEVGSIGNGNQLILPTGTYDVKVIHGTSERWFNGISLSQSQLRNISANF